LAIAIAGLSFAAAVQGADEIVSLDGQFSSFISLGTTGNELLALDPNQLQRLPESEGTIWFIDDACILCSKSRVVQPARNHAGHNEESNEEPL